jgi:hypothetical protein
MITKEVEYNTIRSHDSLGYKRPTLEAVLTRNQYFAMTKLTLKMGQYNEVG